MRWGLRGYATRQSAETVCMRHEGWLVPLSAQTDRILFHFVCCRVLRVLCPTATPYVLPSLLIHHSPFPPLLPPPPQPLSPPPALTGHGLGRRRVVCVVLVGDPGRGAGVVPLERALAHQHFVIPLPGQHALRGGDVVRDWGTRGGRGEGRRVRFQGSTLSVVVMWSETGGHVGREVRRETGMPGSMLCVH